MSAKPSAIFLRYLPAIVLAIGIIAISSSSILTRLSQEEAPSIVIAAFRLTVASLVLFPLVLTNKRTEFRLIDGRTAMLLVLAGFFLALHFASWISSLEFTSVASSVVLVTTTPLWVALLSPILLKEKNNPKIWLGIILAIVGGVIVAGSQTCHFSGGLQFACPGFGDLLSTSSFKGNLLAVGGAWMIAAYIMAGRKLRNRFSLTFYVFCVYSIAALVLVAWVFLAGHSFSGFSSMTYLWMILLGLVPQLIGHSTFNWALGHIPASIVSVAFMAEPVGTVILAFLILSEAPKAGELAGGLLILIGIFIVTAANRGINPKAAGSSG